jgi:antitoxin VapB
MEKTMAFSIRDEAADKALRTLASRKGITLSEAVRIAAENELKRMDEYSKPVDTRPLRERIKAIQDRVASYPKTGLKADKAFFDEMSGN